MHEPSVYSCAATVNCFSHVQQPMRLLVYITHAAVACLSGVIASLFMVACRQQCLISAFSGAACDSGRKCLCSVSLILPLLRSRGPPERSSTAERGLRVATAAKRPVLSWRSVAISPTGPARRAIYSLWWKGLGRGSIGTRQVHWEEGVRSLGNRNQRWGQTAASLRLWGQKPSFTLGGSASTARASFWPDIVLLWMYVHTECAHSYLCACTSMCASMHACVRGILGVCVWHRGEPISWPCFELQ